MDYVSQNQYPGEVENPVEGHVLYLGRALVIFALALPAWAQLPEFGGPSMLTRGQAPAAMQSSQIEIRPFVALTGIYDSGLTGVMVTDQGQLANTGAAGIDLEAGISGVHSWKHTRLGLDYKGDLRHYSRKTYFDGGNQSLMLGVTQRVSRHVYLTLQESAGMYSTGLGVLGLPQTVPFDPASSFVPVTDFFDNRTIYASTQADVTYQKSGRLSFDAGANGFLARRRSTALYGVTGAGARGDVQYRWSRRTTIGVGYSFSHYNYNRVLGSTELHSLVASYAVQLTRAMELTAIVGAMRMETKFVHTVAVDPVIAALIGQTTGNIIGHQIEYLPTEQLRLSRAFSTGVAYLSGGQSVTPGNGLFLTSKMTTVSAGYSYTGIRRWSFNSGISASFGKSIGNVVGDYNTYTGALSASRRIAGALSGLLQVEGRRYQSPDFEKYKRTFYSVRLGIAFSPGDFPLRVW
jgi:hypothetical protein